MKRIIILLLLFTPGLFFGKAFWKMQLHKLDSQTIQQEMDALWQDKYSPVGIELYEDKMFVLSINYQDFASDYFLEVIDLTSHDSESLPRLLNDRIEDSFIPMSISVYQNQLYIIYLKSRLAVLEWDLIPLPESYQAQEKLLNEKGQNGLIPFAISSGSSQRFALLVRLEGWEIKEWLLKSYLPDSGSLRNGINKAIRNDWIPWGLMMNKQESVVLYIKN